MRGLPAASPVSFSRGRPSAPERDTAAARSTSLPTKTRVPAGRGPVDRVEGGLPLDGIRYRPRRIDLGDQIQVFTTLLHTVETMTAGRLKGA